MIYLALIIAVFTLIQLFVVLINLIFIQPFVNQSNSTDDLVSVLIPARNEEKNIGNILSDLKNHDYRNIEILVYNDLSTDKTADIVNQYSLNDNRIKLINSDGLPDGWLGKNHACHSLSKHSKGKYLLFLDADVKIEDGLINYSKSFMQKKRLGLLSIFPQQIMLTYSEKITVPLMNFILLTLLPLVLVYKSRFSSLAAANGQFMMFDTELYRKTLPHEKMKLNKVEDIEIARFYKKNKIKIACLSGKTEIKCRMYSGFEEAVNGFTKNIFNFFGNSPLISLIFWLSTTFGFIPFIFIEDKSLLTGYIATIISIRILVSIVSRQSIFENILFMIPQQIVMGLIIFEAFINHKKKQFVWKGRNIS